MSVCRFFLIFPDGIILDQIKLEDRNAMLGSMPEGANLSLQASGNHTS